MRAIVVAALVSAVAGHGTITSPPPRSHYNMGTAGWCEGDDPSQVPQNGTCLWFNQGCTIGCQKCTGANCIYPTPCCASSMKPTLPKKYRTYNNINGFIDFTQRNPWRAPGFAPIESPCGLAGGWYKTGAPGNGGFPPAGIKQGRDGRTMPYNVKAVWSAGSQQEVSWAITANHGGGYAWRLCPKSAKNDESEECFQKHHLKFVGDKQWIQYGNTSIPHGKANRTAIPALRIAEGTNPPGSEWTRNPIPPCSGSDGGAEMGTGCKTPQFEPAMDAPAGPIPQGMTQRGLYGFGLGRCTSGLPGKQCQGDPALTGSPIPTGEYLFWLERFNFNIIDLVQVPSDLPAGDYVLSFRWDCEQTPQIWADCADVTITAPAEGPVHV